MDLLKQSIKNEQIILDLRAQNPRTIFQQVIQTAVDRELIPSHLAEAVESDLLSPEEIAPTAIGHSVSLPHAYLEGLENPYVIFVRLACAVNLGVRDGIPTRFFFFLLGLSEDARRFAVYLATLIAIGTPCYTPVFGSRLHLGRPLFNIRPADLV